MLALGMHDYSICTIYDKPVTTQQDFSGNRSKRTEHDGMNCTAERRRQSSNRSGIFGDSRQLAKRTQSAAH